MRTIFICNIFGHNKCKKPDVTLLFMYNSLFLSHSSFAVEYPGLTLAVIETSYK
ncbi:hypothetical protein IRB23SM22_19430 [Alkalibacterium sp. s-m-22]